MLDSFPLNKTITRIISDYSNPAKNKMSVLNEIKQQITTNPILLYMKGSPQQPLCGFSAQVATIISSYGYKFAFVDVLDNPQIRSELPKYADWPTFPQLYVKGELVGGCDIITTMHEKGELASLLEATANSD